jgi:HTH-type transcriptional regulator / antitoxin HigA
MTIKVIKTEEQYKDYLSECEMLLLEAPESGTCNSDRLELLIVLIENYENTYYPIEPVSPIDAIKFKMYERDLKQVDLAPYFGTKSRVSEVLSGKRPLTVQMIRALSTGLGISLETLIGLEEIRDKKQTNSLFDWAKFPVKEMVSKGWIDSSIGKSNITIEEQIKSFLGILDTNTQSAAFKKTLKGDAYSPSSQYSIYAWLAKVVQVARSKTHLGQFSQEVMSQTFLKELAQLSWFETGPSLAVEYLERHGIAVVIEPCLKGMSVDGAALKDSNGLPVIALTLRENRLDNFWFTLMHELVHIWKHIDSDSTFVDDLERSTEDKIEAEANRLARDTLIPRMSWKRSEAYLSPSKRAIDELARELKIHPAIIAGRIRRETGNYAIFSDLVGHGEVRKHFRI